MDSAAKYLRQHVTGEVITSPKVRDYFSTDGSVFRVMPGLVVYPRNVTDVRKTARFSWQLAEKGKIVPITARGKGTDQSGGALGSGIMLVFPAHMNNILEIDKSTVTVQPGELYASLQKVLITHGRFLPPYPSSIDFSTIGGAVANNAAGKATIKYGATSDYVKELHVVLANGELITTKRLSKRDLSKKMGESTFEGDIYRQLDALLSDHRELIERSRPLVSKNSAGYNLWDVRRKDGSFDLGKLITGSQGTLGIVTQIKLKTETYNPHTSLVVAYFDDIDKAGQAVLGLEKLGPSALEVVDEHLLNFLDKHSPNELHGLVTKPYPKIILLIEFDDHTGVVRKRKVKKAQTILDPLVSSYSVTEEAHEQAMLWKIRNSAAAVIWQDKGKAKALPIIEDGIVPVENFPEFLNAAYALFKKYRLEIAVWGHAGNANLHMQPFLDLGSVSDRQKVFKIMDEFYKMVIKMGGSTCGEHNDGRLRSPYLGELFGNDIVELFRKVKQIFDPFGILNPGVKLDVSRADQTRMLRDSYDMKHLYDHLPKI
jgi:FAD/FMN-containing dehydrogenase